MQVRSTVGALDLQNHITTTTVSVKLIWWSSEVSVILYTGLMKGCIQKNCIWYSFFGIKADMLHVFRWCPCFLCGLERGNMENVHPSECNEIWPAYQERKKDKLNMILSHFWNTLDTIKGRILIWTANLNVAITRRTWFSRDNFKESSGCGAKNMKRWRKTAHVRSPVFSHH